MTRQIRFLFLLGDCAAGAVTAMAATVAVRLLISPGLDMVAAMMLGMAIGTTVHFAVGVLLSPLLGMFETMVPGMFIGMYGGMLFAMRDSMQRIPLDAALVVGTVFGVAVVLAVELYNAHLRHHSGEEGAPS